MYIFEKYDESNAIIEYTALFNSKEEGEIHSFFDEDNLNYYMDIEFGIYNENLEDEPSELNKIFTINEDLDYDEYKGFIPSPLKIWEGSLRKNEKEIISFLQNHKEDNYNSSEILNKFLEDIKIFEEEQLTKEAAKKAEEARKVAEKAEKTALAVKKFKEEVLWAGLFPKYLEVKGVFENTPKEGLHVTMCFKPSNLKDEEVEHLLSYGTQNSIIIKSYGIDSTNEGFFVKPLSGYYGGTYPHITISWNKYGKPVYTGEIEHTIPIRHGLCGGKRDIIISLEDAQMGKEGTIILTSDRGIIGQSNNSDCGFIPAEYKCVLYTGEIVPITKYLDLMK
jgi:hypothetical protein